jgi:hypothetical protein
MASHEIQSYHECSYKVGNTLCCICQVWKEANPRSLPAKSRYLRGVHKLVEEANG